MKEQLEVLFGEYYHLWQNSHDYLQKRQYKEKMEAINKLLEPVAYDGKNPLTDENIR